MSRLQRDQELSIPGFPGLDFAKSRDPRILRDGISLKFLSRDFTEKVWVCANLTNYMYPDGEFRCCHLVFGVFSPQIHVFWGPMGKRLRISENEDYIQYVVLIFGNLWTWWEHCVLREESMYFSFSEIRENHVVLIFRYSWKPRKRDLFCGLKKGFSVVFFCFPVRNLYWQVSFAKNLTRFGQFWPPEHRL